MQFQKIPRSNFISKLTCSSTCETNYCQIFRCWRLQKIKKQTKAGINQQNRKPQGLSSLPRLPAVPDLQAEGNPPGVSWQQGAPHAYLGLLSVGSSQVLEGKRKREP